MNANFLPLAPGNIVVIDHYVGLHTHAMVYVFDDSEAAAKSVLISIDEIDRMGEIDPMDLDLDYDCTWMESVELFHS